MKYEMIFLVVLAFVVGALWKTFVDHAVTSFVLFDKRARGSTLAIAFPCVCHGGPLDGQLFKGSQRGELVFLFHDHERHAARYVGIMEKDDEGKFIYRYVHDRLKTVEHPLRH